MKNKLVSIATFALTAYMVTGVMANKLYNDFQKRIDADNRQLKSLDISKQELIKYPLTAEHYEKWTKLSAEDKARCIELRDRYKSAIFTPLYTFSDWACGRTTQ